MKNLFILLFILSLGFVQAQETVAYKDLDLNLKGLSFAPKSVLTNGKKAGVLILPAWKGIDEHAKSTGEKLSALGYQVFIADIYGEGNYPTNTKDAAKQSGMFKRDREKYRRRIQLALDQLVLGGADPDEIAIIGFCFGGTGALEAARANLQAKAVVSFHGGLDAGPLLKTDTIQTKVLVCHGADDPYVSESEQEAFRKEMKNAGADWQMIYYSNAVHAFTEPSAGSDNSTGVAYNEKAADRSWEDMLDLFEEVFGL